MKSIILGTRGSALALAQVEMAESAEMEEIVEKVEMAELAEMANSLSERRPLSSVYSCCMNYYSNWVLLGSGPNS